MHQISLHDVKPSRSTSSRRRLAMPAALLLLGASLAALAGSCSESDAGVEGKPCDTVYAGKCGGACGLDADCPAGLYCGSGACTADCAEGAAQCPPGLVCSPHGRCFDGGQGGAGGGVFTGTGTGGAGGDACPDVNVTFEKQIPTVMLLIDQSGSMTTDFAGAGSRWDVLYQTLMNPSTGVVTTLEDEVRFGLALYTSQGGNAGGVCPMLTEVAIALGNRAAIDAVYGPAAPLGDTPTGESLAAVAGQIALLLEPGPKVIVLATDGEPDTCAVPNPQNGQPESIAAAQEAYMQGIETFIISVGDEVGAPHLQDMANAGAGLPVGGAMNAPYYVALNQQSLIDAFQTIINGVRSCTITLNGSVAPEDANKGHVVLDGQELGYNDPNGWQFAPPNQIELLGAACDAIQMGDHDLKVTFPCDTVTPE